jgi:DNA-binding protein HU-beta
MAKAAKKTAAKKAPAKKTAAKTAAKKAPAKKAASGKAKIVTLSLRQLAYEIAEGHELAKKQSVAIFEDLVAIITKHLKKGEKVRMNGLGTLQVRHRAARMGRNPRTGEQVKIKASKKVGFRVAKELKEVI